MKGEMTWENPRSKPQFGLYAGKRAVLDELQALPAESTAAIDVIDMPVSAHQ